MHTAQKEQAGPESPVQQDPHLVADGLASSVANTTSTQYRYSLCIPQPVSTAGCISGKDAYMWLPQSYWHHWSFDSLFSPFNWSATKGRQEVRFDSDRQSSMWQPTALWTYSCPATQGVGVRGKGGVPRMEHGPHPNRSATENESQANRTCDLTNRTCELVKQPAIS